MSVVTFFIDGQPVPKGRPRFSRRGDHVQAYTPKKTSDYEELVAQHGHVLAVGLRRLGVSLPWSGRLALTATFYVERPKSSKRTSEPHRLKKPDVDNLLKSVLDGLEGVLFTDDKIITDVYTRKRYADDCPPGVEVEVTAWN